MRNVSLVVLFILVALFAGAQSKAKKTAPVDLGRFALVEGGSYMMGAATATETHEKPEHSVNIRSFYLAKYELTFDEYDRFCDSTKGTKPSDMQWGRGKRPAVIVSWLDAVAYCNWLSKQEKLQPAYLINAKDVKWLDTASGYRLPTEAEWEYAARGGKLSKGTRYSGADKPDNVAWYSTNSSNQTQPVGTKQPNELNLYDMNGNVWEWVWDLYDTYYYQRSPADNPKGPEEGAYRVTRGGAWYNKADYVTVTTRQYNTPDFRQNSVGFRIARNK